ncbi:MAG: PQQ-dependent sugar dehydrogenase [Candidatus Methylomirabilaceae bacterium]
MYICHTYQAGGETWNRIVRMTERDGRGIVDRVILDRIPASASHAGGRILFGPDGLLYIGTGDSGKAERAQDRTSLAGKILRITRDGGIPPGNPIPGSPVYSLGHRNVQGFGWHPTTKRLYATEHGPTAREGCCRDELNVIEQGRNYGWPVVTGAPGDPRFVDSLADSGERETWAPAGATFVTRGPWADSFVFSGLRGETLYRAVLEGPEGLRVARIERYFAKQFGRLRDVAEAPDGTLYFLTNNLNNPIGRVRPGDDKLVRLIVGP